MQGSHDLNHNRHNKQARIPGYTWQPHSVLDFLLVLWDQKKLESLQSTFSDKTCTEHVKKPTKSTGSKHTRLGCLIQYYRWSKPGVTVPNHFPVFPLHFHLGLKCFICKPALCMLKLPLWNSMCTLLPMLILSSQLDCIYPEVLAMGLLFFISVERASENIPPG